MQSSKAIKLFFDHASPPSRAVKAFLKISKLQNVSEQEIRISKNEHKTESFKQINPLGTLPVIMETQMDEESNGNR